MEQHGVVNLLELPKNKVLDWLGTFDVVLSDSDGVLWHDDAPIPGSPDTINALKALGKQVYFVTNNSTKTRHQIWQRAHGMGYNIEEANIISPTYSVVEYLKNRNFSQKVYVIGGPGLTAELDAKGIQHFGAGPEVLRKMGEYIDKEVLSAPVADVGAVVVGFDEYFTFGKLMKATHFLTMNPDCLLLTTNTDPVHKYPQYYIPGTGAIVSAVETCAEREALVLGKPNVVVCEPLLKAGKLTPERTLMIGDSSRIDVVFGKNCGFRTLLVDNGQQPQREIVELVKDPEKNKAYLPDYYIPRLGDLLAYIS